MSDTVLVALISAGGSCIAAGLGAWALKTTRDVKTAVTKNGGTSNPPTLPDRLHEIDVKLALVLQRQDQQAEEQRDQWSAINELRRRP